MATNGQGNLRQDESIDERRVAGDERQEEHRRGGGPARPVRRVQARDDRREEGAAVGDMRLPFERAAEWTPSLDGSRTYLFVCARGNLSEIIAHELRLKGMDAYSLAGGISRLPTRAA